MMVLTMLLMMMMMMLTISWMRVILRYDNGGYANDGVRSCLYFCMMVIMLIMMYDVRWAMYDVRCIVVVDDDNGEEAQTLAASASIATLISAWAS